MLLVEFTVEHPVLRDTLTRVSDAEAVWEETYRQESGSTRMFFWMRGDDFDSVDAAMAADPSVRNHTVLTAMDGRRLYQADLTDLGRDADLMPQLVAAGAILDEAVGTDSGWRCRAQFPDRDAVETVYRFCRERDIGFVVDRLYERTEWGNPREPSLTDAQRETLLCAVEAGYLEIPRLCTLAELADELGVSESAASERLRRGLKRLVKQTLSSVDR